MIFYKKKIAIVSSITISSSVILIALLIFRNPFWQEAYTPNILFSVEFNLDGRSVRKNTTIKYHVGNNINIGSGPPVSVRMVRGEAIVFSIPDMGEIFILPGNMTSGGAPGTIVAQACGVDYTDMPRPNPGFEFLSYLENFNGECEVGDDALPPMIWFERPGDIDSARWVTTDDVYELSGQVASFRRAVVSAPASDAAYQYTAFIEPLIKGHVEDALNVVDPMTGNLRLIPLRILTTEEF